MFESDNIKKSLEIRIPNLDKAGSMIKLSAELNMYLERIGAKLVLEFNPASGNPKVEVLDSRTGHSICSAAQFKRLGGFRKFLNEQLKEKERNASSLAKVTFVTNNILARKGLATSDVPNRIVPENHQKMIQTKIDVENVVSNIRKIGELQDDKWANYLIAQGQIIEHILCKFSIDCCGSDRMDNDQKIKSLFESGVPRWIYYRFIKKDWIKNEVEHAKQLLFPKGNFLKGVSASFQEIGDKEFVGKNKLIFEGSKFLIEMLGKNPIINYCSWNSNDASIVEALTAEKEKFGWTLLDTNVKELFSPRLQGKNPPSSVEERVSSSGRATTQLSKLKADYRNKLTVLNDQLCLIQHGVIVISNPVNDFWHRIGYDTKTWVITPEKTLFKWIEEVDPELEKVRELMVPTKETTVGLIIGLLMTKCNWFMDFKAQLNFIRSFKYPLNDIADVDNPIPADRFTFAGVTDISSLTTDAREFAKEFLGLSSTRKKDKKNRGTNIPLEPEIKKLIKDCNDLKGINKPVQNWIASSFTGQDQRVRKLAASLIIGSFERDEDLLHDDMDENYESDEESLS